MSRHRKSRGTAQMRTDDKVAPGLRRSRAAIVAAVGLLLAVIGVAGGIVTASNLAQNAQRDATLSKDEVAEIRDYLAEARTRRDAEREQVQTQLDRQTTALCAALAEVATDASAKGRAALARAGKVIGCPALPTTKTTAKPAADADDTSATMRPAEPADGSSRPGAATAPTGTKATPRPTPTPAPTRGGLLDPVTHPVCQLLNVCL